MNNIARISVDRKRIQKMPEHLQNTARIASDQLKCIGLETVGELVGVSHDIGKFCDEFGEYIILGDPKKRGSVNHSAAGALYIYNKYYKAAYEKKDSSAMWTALTAQVVSGAIYCHHMRLYDCINTDAENEFRKRMESKDRGYEEMINIFFDTVMPEQKYDELFRTACGEVKAFINRAVRFQMFGAGMLQKLVYSALIDADRYDAYCFEAEIKYEPVSLPDWEAMRRNLDMRIERFENHFPIDKMRSYISEQCCTAAKCGAGVYRLSVPTGAGKTLASLRFALNSSEENRHIFYIVPYTTILDQTYEEFKEICGDENTLEHHSGVVAEYDEDGGDDADRAIRKIYTERWSAPVILTTFVQFMNSLYAGKPSCARRMRALCNSVLIFDEVQSMPREVICLFTEAVNFLAEVCGCTVLLCTATQPPFEALAEYPLRLPNNSDIVTRSDEEYRNAFKRTTAVNMYSRDGMSCEEIAEFAHKQLEYNRSALIVMNTVSEALRVYDHLDGDFRKIYLSRNKCRSTRKIDISEIKEHTKELCNGESEEKLIVVSTQLVEAGVDISFECAVRALAGIDNLVQTAGRCGRNGEFGHICNVYSINVKDENLSNLKDIELAKRCSLRVLSEINKDEDLLSPEVTSMYYREYLKIDKNKQNPMQYICGKTTIMDMLANNKYYARQAAKPLPILKQAFRTAGKEFSVIKSESIPVLVPCDDTAREYISVLTGGSSVREKAHALKRCGDYTVNLFEYELKRLQEKNAVHFVEEVGVWILSEGFYNNEYGVVIDGELEFCDL